ncbi:hypothetical protein [Sphingobium sp.]|uniref:hypothetical protein n=1 Tax=Sphingobium sp. TaxID=1912891 RepID=UPI002C4267D9|nr:hypothetical protein [Sphingobium sp.]HUD92113.1 hypothetical protein [Sphingobium sp.]
MAMSPSIANAFVTDGSMSSGSITIRVEIPPIAAALQAQAEGAVGIASVSDAKSAVMISLPSEISSSEGGRAAIYTGSDMPVTFMPATGSALDLSPSQSTRLNGMVKKAFTFAPLSAEAIANPTRANGVALVIMAV